MMQQPADYGLKGTEAIVPSALVKVCAYIRREAAAYMLANTPEHLYPMYPISTACT